MGPITAEMVPLWFGGYLRLRSSSDYPSAVLPSGVCDFLSYSGGYILNRLKELGRHHSFAPRRLNAALDYACNFLVA